MLRPYQLETIANVKRDLFEKHHTDVLAVLATGLGKTQVFLQFVIDMLAANPTHRALILVHRAELAYQPVERIATFWPEWKYRTGIVMADLNETRRSITVATVQTLSSERRLQQLLVHGAIDYLVTDEAHHSNATSYLALVAKLRAANPNLKHLGVTATPLRADGDGLAKVFQHCSHKVSIKDGVKGRYLVPVKALAISTKISLRGVKSAQGDFVQSQLKHVFETDNCLDLVVATHQKYAPERQAICFTVSVDGAHTLAEKFNEAGISSAAIDGTTAKEERKRVLRAFQAGEIKVLCNCMVLTEGFDAPAINAVHMVRPTKSDSLYVQCLDLQTEVLTDHGWKRYNTIDIINDRVAGFDVQTNEVRFVAIQDRFIRPLALDEQMYSIASPSLDIRVTGGHRMLMRHRRSPDLTWRFVTAEELYKKQSEYQIPVAGFEQTQGVPLSDDDLRFLGWFLTDGTYNPANGQIAITQAEHQPYHDAIRSCLEGCGFKYTIRRTNGYTQFNETSPRISYLISKGQPRGIGKHLTGWGRLESYIDKDLSPLLEDMTTEQLDVLLEAIHMGDGNKQRGQTWEQRSYHISSGRKVFAERLQSLCLRHGYRCNIFAYTNDFGNQQYLIHIKKNPIRYVGGQNQTDREHLEITPSYDNEQVWCVQNELSTLIIRRNGKTAIVGNCIGRGLRPAPEKEDCLIFDYAPAETRNIVMAGDVLGVPAEIKKEQDKAQDDLEQGDAFAGFTFDGEARGVEGDPLELVARELNYLDITPYAWQKNEGYLTLSIKQGKTLVITPLRPSQDAQNLLLVTSEKGRPAHVEQLLDGPFADLTDYAQSYADEHGDPTFQAKDRSWRKRGVTEKQIELLRKFGFRNETIFKMTASDASAIIGWRFTKQALRNARWLY
jgi:superfamily II DNA or RNA helicase